VLELIRQIAPMMIAQSQNDASAPSPEVVQLMLGGNDAPILFLMRSDSAPMLAVPVDVNLIPAGRSTDDLEGELTVFGLVQRVVASGESMRLDRYVLPGMNRAMRKAFETQGGLSKAFASLPDQFALSDSDLELQGPAVIVRTAAIFN
jgi:hypothetical protein